MTTDRERARQFMAKQGFADSPSLEEEFAAIRAECADRIHALERALSFAASCIKSGEPWTSVCERKIIDVLDDRIRKGDTEVDEMKKTHVD